MTRYVNIDDGSISNVHPGGPRWFRVVEGAEPEVGSVWVYPGYGVVVGARLRRGALYVNDLNGKYALSPCVERMRMRGHCIALPADAEAVLARIRGGARHEPAPAAEAEREPTHYVDPYIGARGCRAAKNLDCERDDYMARDPVQPYAGQAERIRAILGDAVPPELCIGWDPLEVDDE